MSNLTVSSKVDTFMQATTSEGMQKAIMDTSVALTLPLVIAIKKVTVLTSGTPADVASVSLPAWLTGWALANGSSLTLSRAIAETASGTLAGASFSIRDTASGGGNQVGTIATGPSASGLGVAILGIGPTTAGRFTNGTIYINQVANSANEGTVSFYLTLVPYL